VVVEQDRTSFSARRFLCSSSSSLSLFRFLSLLLCFSLAMRASRLCCALIACKDSMRMHDCDAGIGPSRNRMWEHDPVVTMFVEALDAGELSR